MTDEQVTDELANEVTGLALMEAVAKVKHAASPEVSRPILHAVIVDGQPNGLWLAAMDNYRIATMQVAEGDWAWMGKLPLHQRYLPELVAFCKAHEGLLRVSTGPGDKYDTEQLVLTYEAGPAELRLPVWRSAGSVPKYHEVLDSALGQERMPIGVAGQFLADTAKAWTDRTRHVPITLEVAMDSPYRPLVIKAGSEREYLEVIMPVRLVGQQWPPAPKDEEAPE